MRLNQRTSSHLRDTAAGLVLCAVRSSTNEALQFPPPAFTHGNDVVEEVTLGPVGVLYTYSIVHLGRDKPAYGLAMVDFEPGVRVFGLMRFQPGLEPALGTTMKVVAHTLSDGQADYAFEAVVAA